MYTDKYFVSYMFSRSQNGVSNQGFANALVDLHSLQNEKDFEDLTMALVENERQKAPGVWRIDEVVIISYNKIEQFGIGKC